MCSDRDLNHEGRNTIRCESHVRYEMKQERHGGLV